MSADAFAAEVLALLPAMESRARRLRADDPENIAAEAVLRVWIRHVRGGGVRAPQACLRIITTRLCIDARRRQEAYGREGDPRRQIPMTDVPFAALSTLNGIAVLEHADAVAARVARVRVAVADLSPARRAAVDAAYVRDLGIPAAAAELGIAPGALRVRLCSARRLVAAAVRDAEEHNTICRTLPCACTSRASLPGGPRSVPTPGTSPGGTPAARARKRAPVATAASGRPFALAFAAAPVHGVPTSVGLAIFGFVAIGLLLALVASRRGLARIHANHNAHDQRGTCSRCAGDMDGEHRHTAGADTPAERRTH